MTPGAYQRGGRGLSIRYAVASSFLGRVLVAATDRGICAVSLGASDRALERALCAEFPNAEIARDAGLAARARAVVRGIDGRGAAPAFALDLRGTDFQRRVWNALRRIPRGETRTYREVAEAAGRPSAVRAVARACAANKIALLVPCHRVVRGDGGLGGYRWGAGRKAKLLEREGARKPRAASKVGGDRECRPGRAGPGGGSAREPPSPEGRGLG